MKKLLLTCAFALLGLGQSFAQLNTDDYGLFNHLSAGLSVGSDGIGINLAAPLGYHFAVRAGYSFMPKFKYKKGIDLGSNPAFTTSVVDLQGKLNMSDFSLLFDYYPSKKSSFRITAGAYIGKSKVVTIANTNPFVKQSYWGNAGLELGTTASIYDTYTVVSDPRTGNVSADVKVNSFKPYIGIGFGRAIPKKRIGVQFDLGVQFWGTPELWTNIETFDYNKNDYVMEYRKVSKNRITNPKKDYQDVKDAIRKAEKIGVFPVLKVRINGRIF